MEDADALELNALKKAYAEVLLNVSKEAAARVLASEKRGLRLQQELSCAKEEGLQLLLRLNQMFDAKKIETETVSISQQRKIEELEAQLEEAEGIYTALRKDLRKAQSALSKAAINNSEPPNQNCTSTTAAFPGEVLSSLQRRDFGILVKTRKGPEHYKNECAQRIHEFEGNQLCLSGREGEEEDSVEEEACVGGLEHMDIGLDPSSSKSHKTVGDLFEVKDLDANHNIVHSEAIGSFQTKRKRTNRYKKRTNLWSSSNCLEPEVPHGNCEKMIQPCTSKVETGCKTSHLLIESDSVKLPKNTIASDMDVVHGQIGGDKFRYTFQRRRKKQLICSNGNFSAEEVLKIETEEQHDCSKDPESVVDLTSSGSSRHSMQQLVEVS